MKKTNLKNNKKNKNAVYKMIDFSKVINLLKISYGMMLWKLMLMELKLYH